MTGVNTIIKENTCVSFTTTLYSIMGDDVGYAGFSFRKPFSNPLMAEVTNGWYIEGPLGGPGVTGRVQITGGIEYEDAQAKGIIITSNTTYYSLQLYVDYTFYSPECINGGYLQDFHA